MPRAFDHRLAIIGIFKSSLLAALTVDAAVLASESELARFVKTLRFASLGLTRSLLFSLSLKASLSLPLLSKPRSLRCKDDKLLLGVRLP
jgi:hypothetical protein